MVDRKSMDGKVAAPAHISPQAHVLTAFFFVIAVASCKRGEIYPLLPFFAYPAALAFAGGVFASLPSVAKKLAIASPLILTLGIFGSWEGFFSLVLRFVLSVSTMLILVEIIGFAGFCAALSRIFVPRAMITQLMLMHRYSFLLRDEVRRLRCAYGLRAPRASKIALKDFCSMAGNLLLRTFDRAEAIHQAMLCRGFSGALPSRDASWGGQDFLYIFTSAGIFFIIRNYI